jgi:hypothetical protein
VRNDKYKAIELRRAGKSYKEIRAQLGIPLGTLSGWFSKESWSQEVQFSLPQQRISIPELHRIRGLKLDKLYAQAKREAEREYDVYKNSPLFVAGLTAYWGEGDKVSKYWCRLSNVDPGMIRLYIAFLTKVCNIAPARITASLLLYPDLDEEVCIAYWIESTGLPRHRFRKTMVVKGRHKTKKLTYGVCYVVVSSRYLKEKMLVWLRLLGQEFPKNADMV